VEFYSTPFVVLTDAFTGSQPSLFARMRDESFDRFRLSCRGMKPTEKGALVTPAAVQINPNQAKVAVYFRHGFTAHSGERVQVPSATKRILVPSWPAYKAPVLNSAAPARQFVPYPSSVLVVPNFSVKIA
jgi:hypothetical protein